MPLSLNNDGVGVGECIRSYSLLDWFVVQMITCILIFFCDRILANC